MTLKLRGQATLGVGTVSSYTSIYLKLKSKRGTNGNKNTQANRGHPS